MTTPKYPPVTNGNASSSSEEYLQHVLSIPGDQLRFPHIKTALEVMAARLSILEEIVMTHGDLFTDIFGAPDEEMEDVVAPAKK